MGSKLVWQIKYIACFGDNLDPMQTALIADADYANILAQANDDMQFSGFQLKILKYPVSPTSVTPIQLILLVRHMVHMPIGIITHRTAFRLMR